MPFLLGRYPASLGVMPPQKFIASKRSSPTAFAMEETMANNDASNELLNLWKSQEPQSISLSAKELRDASSKLERQIFWRNSREYLGAAIVVVAFGFYMYEFQTVLLRLGSGLTIAGALFVAFHLFQKGSASAMATDLESKSCVEFHRMELARQRDQ